MPALELLRQSFSCGYYVLAALCLHKAIFICYGVYADLVLTRAYIQVLRTGETLQICYWSEHSASCVPPSGRAEGEHLSVIKDKAVIARVWAPWGYRWSFHGVEPDAFSLLPHAQGWLPGSVRIDAPWGAYHHATLSWGGRLSWRHGIITPFLESASYSPTEQESQPRLPRH